MAAVEPWFLNWDRAGEELHAHALRSYEVASATARLVKASRLVPADLARI